MLFSGFIYRIIYLLFRTIGAVNQSHIHLIEAQNQSITKRNESIIRTVIQTGFLKIKQTDRLSDIRCPFDTFCTYINYMLDEAVHAWLVEYFGLCHLLVQHNVEIGVLVRVCSLVPGAAKKKIQRLEKFKLSYSTWLLLEFNQRGRSVD